MLSQFELSLDGGHGAAALWDLLILDEGHNCAPASGRKYIRDSGRTRALRRIAPLLPAPAVPRGDTAQRL